MKKNYVKVIAGQGLALLLLPALAAHAQDTTRTLKDVIVTASRSPKKKSETGRVVEVISAKEIARSQGKTLPQLLNTVAGITFSGANNNIGQSSDVYVRGASAGNTLILVDGFPVNDASSIAGNYDLNAFPLDQIDHIEILKGSGSTLYGSDAVAGVINIITKRPIKQGLKATAQVAGGSYSTFNEAVGLNGKLNNTGIALNLSNTDSKGFSIANDKTGTNNFDKDGYHQKSVSLNLNQYLSSRFTLSGNLQLTHNNGDNDYGAFTDDKDYTYKRTYLLGGIGGKLLLDKGAFTFNASQNNVWNEFKNLPGDNFATSQLTSNIGRVTNIEGVLNYTFNPHLDLTSGVDYKYSNTKQYSDYATTGYAPGPSVLPARLTNTIMGSAYSSLFYSNGVFHMEVGGRLNNHSRYGENFTYTINPSVFLFDRLKVFVTAASAYKAPTLYQLYSQYGNLELKPEKTTQSWEAGFDLDIVKNMLSFNTAFYKRRIKDAIDFYTDPKTFASYYINVNKQNDKGFESELKLTWDKLSASAYAAYVVGRQTTGTGTEVHNLYRRPKNTYGANANYQVLKQVSVGLNYKYVGDRSDYVYPAAVILKHYSLLDANVQVKPLDRLTIFGNFNNILDEKYVDWTGYNTRRFNFMAGVKYQFN